MARPSARASHSASPPRPLFGPSHSASPFSSSSASPNVAPTSSLSSVVDGALARWQQLGLNLRRAWLTALAQHIQISSPTSLVSVDAFTKAAYQYILSSPFHSISRPTLPAGLASAHRRRLPSQYILLVLSSLNTLAPPSSSLPTATPPTRRLLKLTLTDGWQLVAGIEVKGGVASLPAEKASGYKVAVRDVEVWRGVILLDDSNTVFLGGEVRGEDEEARLTDGSQPVAGAWDGKGTEEYKQPPSVAPPFPAPSSAARLTGSPASYMPPSIRPSPSVVPCPPPLRPPAVQPEPRFSSPLPSSLPPLEHATQYQPLHAHPAHRTSPRAADERKADSGVPYWAADDEFAVADERMHEFYPLDAMESEELLIEPTTDSDRPHVSSNAAQPPPPRSPPPPSPVTVPFVRASSIRAATAGDPNGAGMPVVTASSSLLQSSSSLLSLPSAVVDARYGSSTASYNPSAASRTSYTTTPTTLPTAVPSLIPSSHTALTTRRTAALPPSSSTVVSASVIVPSSVAPRKKKARPHVDDPFYLPSTALSQDDSNVQGEEEEEQDGDGNRATAVNAESVKAEQRSSLTGGHGAHTVAVIAAVETVVDGPVAMIEHDISGPEELAEAHHYLMQSEEREKQKQASDSLPPLEEVDDYFEASSKEDTAAVLDQRAAVDVIALDDSDDDILDAPSSGTSSSSPPVPATHASTTSSTSLCTADCPFTYIHSLLRLLRTITASPRLFLIKGYLVTNSNSVTWPAFSMQVLVDDGSGGVECAMDGRLLETSVFCCTPQQLLAMSSDEQARLLKEAEKRVVLMEGFMVLRVTAGCLPTLLSVHEPDMATVTAVVEQQERHRQVATYV